jgi:hypothetical protein
VRSCFSFPGHVRVATDSGQMIIQSVSKPDVCYCYIVTVSVLMGALSLRRGRVYIQFYSSRLNILTGGPLQKSAIVPAQDNIYLMVSVLTWDDDG